MTADMPVPGQVPLNRFSLFDKGLTERLFKSASEILTSFGVENAID